MGVYYGNGAWCGQVSTHVGSFETKQEAKAAVKKTMASPEYKAFEKSREFVGKHGGRREREGHGRS